MLVLDRKTPKLFPCHRSEKTLAKSNHCHTSKTHRNNLCVCHTSETPLGGLPISVRPKRGRKEHLSRHRSAPIPYPPSSHTLTHSLAQRPSHNSFPINRLHTLFIATGGVRVCVATTSRGHKLCAANHSLTICCGRDEQKPSTHTDSCTPSPDSPLATAILYHYPLPAAHYPPFFPGNFPSSPLVPISKNRPLGRPGGFQSCPTVTGVSSPKPLSSPPPFSSFRRPAHSRNLPPLRQAPLNQRHPSPRTVGCTSASSVPTPKAKPSASTSRSNWLKKFSPPSTNIASTTARSGSTTPTSVTSISAPSSKPSAPRRTASSSPCRATIATFASPS